MALKAKKVQEKVKSVRKESTKDKKKTRASESKHAKVATTEKVVPVTKDSKKDKKVKDKSERKRPVVEVPKAEKKSKKDDAKTQEKHQVMEKESKKKKKSVDDQKTCANQQNTKNAAVASQEGGGGPSAGTAVAPLTLPIPPRRVSFKSPPSTVVSETPSPRKTLFPSPDASPALSLDNLQVWKVEASKKGMSLEEYMEEISRTNFDQSVERHMRALMAEQQQDAEAAHEPSMPLPGTPGAPVASHESSMPLPGTSLAVPETQLAKKEKENNEVEKEDNDSDSLSLASMADSDSSDSDDGQGNDEPDNEDEQESKSEDDDEEEEEEPVDMQALESEIDKMIEPEKTKPEETKTAPSLKPAESTQADNATKVQEAVSQQLALKDEKATEFAKANSTSHKAEWDKFSRQCMDRKKFPQSLAGVFLKDKTDLFRSWLECSQNWDQVVVEVQRKAESVTLNRSQREGVKAREIHQRYPKSKADSLIKSLRSRGLWYWDPDFADDEEEIFYYLAAGNVLRKDDKAIESTAVSIKDRGNKDLVDALTLGDGPLSCGFQPGMLTANEAGQKALAEAIQNDETKAEKKKAPKTEKPEKREPKTLEELVAARMDECLKKGADARKSAIALGSLEYSGDLSKQLMQFSDKMEKVFKILQDLRSRKISDPDQYSKYFDILDEKMQWYNKADAAANGLLKGLNAKPKKAAKGKSKAKKDEEGTTETPPGDGAA